MSNTNEELREHLQKRAEIKSHYKFCYTTLHKRVSRSRGKPRKCENCETETAKKYEWANKTGQYDDVMDYVRLCTSCHHRMDGLHTGKHSFVRKLERHVKVQVCLACKAPFETIWGAQKYCGSKVTKSGCAHMRYVDNQKNKYRLSFLNKP